MIYSLSQELSDKLNESIFLEKKMGLNTTLLTKTNDQNQICKLERKKEELEKEKINLSFLIKKLEYIKGSGSIFEFIRSLYILTIEKENFETFDENISLALVKNLKDKEEELYKRYIDGNFFSNALRSLSFEFYQCYFDSYTKNFFGAIQDPGDPYINSLLTLKVIFGECSYFNQNSIDLTQFKSFFSTNVPGNVSLPSLNFELLALRCFFSYKILLAYLKLQPVRAHFDQLKKSVNLELCIINYKANTKNALIVRLNSLQINLDKKIEEYENFIKIDKKEPKDTDAIFFFKEMKGKIKNINKIAGKLLRKKYLNLTKMQNLLASIVNKAHHQKFLELFNAKISSDFLLDIIKKKSDYTERIKEGLNFLYYTSTPSRNTSCSPLSEWLDLFIDRAKAYPKADITILDDIELEDLIELSFYCGSISYFYSHLKEFNDSLVYSELVLEDRFLKIKLETLKKDKIKERINKFYAITDRDQLRCLMHKENILDDIECILGIINESINLVSGILESTANLKREFYRYILPDENELKALLESLKDLREKKQFFESEYLRIKEHNLFKAKVNIKEINTNSNLDIEHKESIGCFLESLSCLSENLFESLKLIEENTKDINRAYKKIFSSKDRIFLSIQKLSSSLSSWKDTNKTTSDLTSLSLPKLLEKAEELVKKNFTGEGYLKELDQAQELFNNSSSLFGFFIKQLTLIRDNYITCDSKAKEILNSLKNNKKSQFFSKSMSKKLKRQINGNFSNDYSMYLQEQTKTLKELIGLFKYNTDDRVIELYATIKEKEDDCSKRYYLLNEEIKTQSYIKEKKSKNDDKEVTLPQPTQVLEEEVEKIPAENLSEEQAENFVQNTAKSLRQDAHADNSVELSLVTEVVRSTDKCNKLMRSLKEEHATKERAKAGLKAVVSDTRKYNSLMSRIDPFNVGTPTIVKTNANSNQSQPEIPCLVVPAAVEAETTEANTCNNYPQSSPPAACSISTPVMFYPAPPQPTMVVVDTYHLVNRTVFYSCN